MRKKKIKFEESSGNVFADLGLKDSDELYARARIGFCVHKSSMTKTLNRDKLALSLALHSRMCRI